VTRFSQSMPKGTRERRVRTGGVELCVGVAPAIGDVGNAKDARDDAYDQRPGTRIHAIAAPTV